MNRVLNLMRNFILTSLLTAGAAMLTLSAFARSCESAMFNSGHEPEAVTINSEVRSGIGHPSRVGSREGERLSAADFCFIQASARMERKENSETYESSQHPATVGGHPACVQRVTGLEARAGGNSGGRRQHLRSLGQPVAPAHQRSGQTSNQQLSYGCYEISTFQTAQDNRTEGAVTEKAAATAGWKTGSVFEAAFTSSQNADRTCGWCNTVTGIRNKLSGGDCARSRRALSASKACVVKSEAEFAIQVATRMQLQAGCRESAGVRFGASEAWGRRISCKPHLTHLKTAAMRCSSQVGTSSGRLRAVSDPVLAPERGVR